MGDACYDIIIVGGGVMGSGTAYHLMQDSSLKGLQRIRSTRNRRPSGSVSP